MSDYDLYRNSKVMFYLEGIRNGTRMFPPSLQIALTDHCFNKCTMCGHWQREKKCEVDIDVLLEFLDQVALDGLETVCYSGGDPLVYPHINSVMEWHVADVVPFGMITAGYIPESVNLQLLSKAEWIRVSLDSVDEAIYSDVRGGIKLSDVVESLDRIKKFGNVEFGVTLTSHNLPKLMELTEYAIKLKVKRFRLWPVRHYQDDKSDTNWINRLQTVKYFLQVASIDNNIDDAVDIILHGELESFQHCKAVLFQLFIDASGDIYPCCILAGDSNEKQLIDFNFGNIKNLNCESLYGHIKRFSDLKREQLPLGCNGCTKRLQTINRIAAENWNSKFFI